MKNSSLLLLGSILVLPLILAGCNRNDQMSGNETTAQTNVVVTPAPLPNPPADTTNSSLTPNAPARGPSSAVPAPEQSSKNTTTVGPSSTTVTSPASESSKNDTNAAPASSSPNNAPSQSSK